MERSYTTLNKSSSNFPTLLSSSKYDPKKKLRLDLSNKSIIIPTTSRVKPLVQSITPRASIQASTRPKPSQVSEALKSPVKNFSIKPILKSDILKFPSPPQVILNFMPDLPAWVQLEMNEFREIYYLCKPSKGPNKDCDDDKGDYKVVIGDDVKYRYEIQDLLGKGSFGQVVKVFDHLTKKTLALKIIKNRQRYLDQAKIEIEILNLFKQCPSDKLNYIVQLEESFEFRGHMMIVFELLGLNLYELLKRNSFRGLSTTLIKRISQQVLHSLTVLAKEHVIHCDLKPENILLSDTNLSLVKLIDFGSSCYSNQRVYTYIQSRFYRAPEVVLGIPYTSAIDIWSFGCILVELYTGIPIFSCETEKELMGKIIEVIGEPPKELLIKGSRSHVFFNADGFKYDGVKIRKLPGSRGIRGILKGADEDFVQIVEACLRWDPALRTNSENAAKSLWFVEDGEKNPNVVKKKYKISIEDITKHTPQLQKFIARRNNTLK